jgi:tRNA-specific 2-thiouridylase
VLERELPADAPALAPGPFIASDGTVLGEHDGYARFTVGQRRGLPGGQRRPLYVLAVRPDDRAVLVGSEEELAANTVQLDELNWLADPLGSGDRCEVQIRYRSRAVPARIANSAEAGLALLTDQPLRAVTPGQSGVLYGPEGRVLGGGVIAA